MSPRKSLASKSTRRICLYYTKGQQISRINKTCQARMADKTASRLPTLEKSVEMLIYTTGRFSRYLCKFRFLVLRFTTLHLHLPYTLNMGGVTNYWIDWANPENFTLNSSLLNDINSSLFAKKQVCCSYILFILFPALHPRKQPGTVYRRDIHCHLFEYPFSLITWFNWFLNCKIASF